MKNKNAPYIIILIIFIVNLLILFVNYNYRNLSIDAKNLFLYISSYFIIPVFAVGIVFYSYNRIRIEKIKILKICDIISVVIGVFILFFTFISIFIKNENIIYSVGALCIFFMINAFIKGISKAIILSLRNSKD